VLADRGAPGSGRQTIAIRFGEFVALIAAMMSIQAIAIDAMLPAIPTIAGALRVSNPNHGQWIVTTYMAGLGTGQLVWGVLSDRFGRRPILLGGMALYFVAALVCGLTRSFEALLAWRFVHGLAAASVTVIRCAISMRGAGWPGFSRSPSWCS
jgi:DHA1 family bicyclomycin/chloramphenicol resistance-like MFS transporter